MWKWDLTKLPKKAEFKTLKQLFAGIKSDPEETDCESKAEEEEETVQKKLMDKEETWQAAEEGERPPSSLISGQSQKTKEVEMRWLTEENERLRCQTESLKEEMRNMAEDYESRQTKL
ncbi:hypothetical protein ACLB2K_038670 [Fragaria x ananassa]